METAFTQLPGYVVNEYLLVLNPHEALRHKIEKSRLELTEKYHIAQPPAGRPHVSLVSFAGKVRCNACDGREDYPPVAGDRHGGKTVYGRITGFWQLPYACHLYQDCQPAKGVTIDKKPETGEAPDEDFGGRPALFTGPQHCTGRKDPERQIPGCHEGIPP